MTNTKPGTFKIIGGMGQLLEHGGTKSYATEEGLTKALAKLGFTGPEHRYLMLKTLDGRYTAVFAQSNFKNGGYIGLYSQHGFITFG